MVSRLKEPPTSAEDGFEAGWRARFDRFAARGGSDALISGWSEHGLRRRLEVIEGLLDSHPPAIGARVVDLGCGSGVYCAALGDRGFRAVGADFSIGMLRRAREVTGSTPLVAADLNALPFRSATFGGLVNVGVLQHLGAVDRALSEMGRVLAPGAVAYVITLNRLSLHGAVAWLRDTLRAWSKGRFRAPRHAVRRSVRTLTEEARRAGLEPVAVRGVYLLPGPLRRFESLLDRLDSLPSPLWRGSLVLPLANAFALVLRRREIPAD